ncbi:MAG: endonuclease [Chitinophagaceae bacterium]|nr:endonuclease [Chitinophagaceae bacterium]
MKLIFTIFMMLGICASEYTYSQYYQSALGLTGANLQNTLHSIIGNQTQLTYSGLWNYYQSTDTKPGNIIWDIYSDIPGGTAPYTFTWSTDQCTNSPNSESICYNREHTWPSTYFNDFYPMYADLFLVMPTDAWVNNKRNNFPYGKVNSATWTSQNGSKLGVSTSYSNWSSTNPNHWAFEPIDSFKGDVARNYFYIATRYLGEDASWYNWEMATGAVLSPAAVTLLLDWHHKDPVSQKEINRNNAVYAIQGNRNPFIDYPIFADCIWGTSDCTPLATSDLQQMATSYLYPNPATNRLHISDALANQIKDIRILYLDGRIVQTKVHQNQIVDISDLAAGSYVLSLSMQDGSAKTLPFIKSNR